MSADNQGKADNDIAQQVVKGLQGGGGLSLSDVKQLLHVETSTKIGEVQKGTGFSALATVCDKTKGIVKVENLPTWTDLQFEVAKKSGRFEDDILREGKRTFLLYEGSGEWSKVMLTFQCMQGAMAVFCIAMQPGRMENGEMKTVHAASYVAHGTFELAPDIRIVTESESDFFSKSVTEKIVYCNRGFNEEDRRMLAAMILQPVADEVRHFIQDGQERPASLPAA
eukprot:CAMPEP_0202809144 /NCGR_PEP_ID=MMETSP1389-20130828/1526_1 /ASSEMBLY_ACC=CAM_ASM_000865 /TAXON_ID=302021 /ORGANISM="Rhodomonas sp., Strain CCMP768" /LENGTH=224 /DNA_ID=CAMNT_0049479669 /DNA_START=100 /DNA_END=774 /DNA_ORIENTATION=-